MTIKNRMNQAYPPLLYMCKKTFLYLVLIFSINSGTCQAQVKEKPWANPVLIYGSSFGNIFQQLYLTNNFTMMLNLTASESRRQHSDSVILQYYQQMQFAYPITLLSHDRDKNKYKLIYKANINATFQKLKVDIIVENDTARIVLPINFKKSRYFFNEIH